MPEEDLNQPDPDFDYLRQCVLNAFPIGSRWYDCNQDTCGTVDRHFHPRGLLLKMDTAMLGYTFYHYGQLLSGQLRKPREGGRYFEFQREKRQVDEMLQEFTGSDEIWA